MTLYFYTARTFDGKEVSGTVDALNDGAARSALLEMKLEPMEIHEATQKEKKATKHGIINRVEELEHHDSIVMETEPATKPGKKQKSKKKHNIFNTDSKDQKEKKQKSDSIEKSQRIEKTKKRKNESTYYPFIDTLRLYAGWLLAWYCLVYLLGGYQYTREAVPYRIPFVEALLPPFSPAVLVFTLVAFLFLFLTSLQRILGGGIRRSFGLTILGVAIFGLYTMNL